MSELMVCRDLSAREPNDPAENRVDESHHSVEVGKIAEHILGLSLARLYSAKQLREINRRSIQTQIHFSKSLNEIQAERFCLK